MSQHWFFCTTEKHGEVGVLAGWDRPLQGFFLTIELVKGLDGKDSEDEFLYSNLDDTVSHPKAFGPFDEVLARFGIKIPEQMRKEIVRDGVMNTGNKYVRHRMLDGNYIREEAV